MKLLIFNEKYSIIQLPEDSILPRWVNYNENFVSITRTDDELSIVCRTSSIPENENFKRNDDWIIIKIDEIMDFSMTGIVYSIAKILKENNISIFVISTYNTDYVLIKNQDKEKAIKCLSKNYEVNYKC